MIDRFVDRAVRALTDATRNNPLLYYRQSKSTRFTVPPLGSAFIGKLLEGAELHTADFEAVVAALAPQSDSDDAVDDAQADQVVGDASPAKPRQRPRATKSSPLQSRLQKMRAKARENEEERGLQTLFAAVCMATWPAMDGGRPPLAPLFLIPIEINEDKSLRGNYVVQRVADGEIVFNRAILALAPTLFREQIAELFEGGVVDDVSDAYQRVAAAANHGGDVVAIEQTCAVGIFNYSMMAVVTDLDEARDKLAEHIIVRALAGDGEAQKELSLARDGAVELQELDRISPPDEPFVLDADPWQAQAIQTLRRFGTSHATIDGPPGTGKSQTIANLIASFIAQGKSVLFCCEKRAALDVVKARLTNAALDHLVLDLHGAGVTRQRAYQQLKRARGAVSQAQPAQTSLDPVLEQTRATLIAHDRFMHSPLPGGPETPFGLLNALAALPDLNLPCRLDVKTTEALRPRFEQLANDVSEAARWPEMFLHKLDVPWASARKLEADQVASALEHAVALAATLDQLTGIFGQLRLVISTREELESAVATMRAMRIAVLSCSPEICAIDPEIGAVAARTLRSPFGLLEQIVSPARRAALRAVRPYINTAKTFDGAEAVEILTALTEPWKRSAVAIANLPTSADQLLARVVDDIEAAERVMGRPLPPLISEMQVWVAECARDRSGAYRAARIVEIEATLAGAGLEPLIFTFQTLEAGSWSQALRYVYLQSRLEPLRPILMRFDGRTQDVVVSRFATLEADLRCIAADRVRRAAAERFVATSREAPDQATSMNVQLERVRSKKPLRKLFEDVPNVMLALVPCVMASPLTVSQFLPRRPCFDVVIFDEGSQMAPESAISAILRGKRVVIAGDDRQLPPTSFFASAIDQDDDEEEQDAAAGTESVLTALRPFTKPLGLRIHYRSRDERLIAFSNYYLYNNDLVTFPGVGNAKEALRFVAVDPSGSETDEDSATPEVARVVNLILEHAETSPDVSLGVIALGLKHATRIDSYLADVRRNRPELDVFFDDTKKDPFFIKNLERVQGDERDRIILTIGYGRTKTGAVSHNFGPIAQAGGERRLNVAITRAKDSLTLVASFRKSDLNPSSLNSDGAKLLAAYLGYVESGGNDLGRDGADPRFAPSPIELEVQVALEQRLGTSLIPQYGVGQFRIDLAVQHPASPGRFVLAIEFDGATYHSSPTARLRDRQRQQILEDKGWTFCRIWSTDWFNNREGELARVAAMYHRVLSGDNKPVLGEASASAIAPAMTVSPLSRIGACPVGLVRNIAEVSDGQLRDLIAWINSDGCLRTDEELFEEMFAACGFSRRGPRIVERFHTAIVSTRNRH